MGTGKGFYIAAAGGAAYQNLAHITKTIQDAGFDVQLEDKSHDMGMLSLQGPMSKAILSQLTDSPLDNENFPFSTNKMIKIAGHDVRALRVSFVGELGWELHIPRESCIPVYMALVEAGLLFTCKLKTDTDFLGREALEKHRQHGARKKKVCFTVDEDICLVGLEGIVRNGEYVGHIRRGDHAYFIDKEVAYGYVSKPDGGKLTQAWLGEGDYQIEARGRLYDARIHLKTPFDSANNRIQGRYDIDEGLIHAQEQKLLDYKSMINSAVSVRYLHTYS